MKKKILIVLLSLIIFLGFIYIQKLNIFNAIFILLALIGIFVIFQKMFEICFSKADILSEKQNKIILFLYIVVFLISILLVNFNLIMNFDSNSIIILANSISLIITILLIYKWCRRKKGKHYSYFALFLGIIILPIAFHCYKCSYHFSVIFIPLIELYLLDCFNYQKFKSKRNVIVLFLIYLFFLYFSIFNKFFFFLYFLISFVFINSSNDILHKKKSILLMFPMFIYSVLNIVFYKNVFYEVTLSFNTKIFFMSLTVFNLVIILKNLYVKKTIEKKIYFELLYTIFIMACDDYFLNVIPLLPIYIVYISLTISNYYFIRFNYLRYIRAKKINKVSVIVPNYNYAQYINKRIDSILYQKYPIFELIILDDASSDQSDKIILEKIKSIKKDFPDLKVRYLPNEKNSGNVFKQWEKCFDEATGDYIWICEADDLCSKFFLNVVMKGFEDPNVVISYSESLAIDENGKVFKKDLRDWIDMYNLGKWNHNYINDGKEELKSTMCINNTIANVSSVVFKNDKNIEYKKYLKEAQKFELAGDWYFYSKVLLNGKIAYFDDSLNYHRMHTNSVTNTTDNFTHYKEVLFIQDSINNDVDVPKRNWDLAIDRRKNLQRNLCISNDEIYYDKMDLSDLLIRENINDEILLSIIIPVYNVEKYIDKCLKSVFKNLPIKTEVIVINDGSPDNSEDIILKYKKKYSNLVYIKKSNGGLSSVKNVGLGKAKGRYIIFLDSDDYVSSNMYSVMLKKAIDKNADYIYCDVLMVFEDGNVKYCGMTNYERKGNLMQIMDNNLMAASWNKMIKRELYNGLQFPEGINNEDVAVSPLILLRANHIEKVESPFYKYVQRSGSIQNSGFTEKRFMIFDTAKICFEMIKKYDYITREKVEGTIITHQLLAMLIWPISEIKNNDERLSMIKLFCERFNELGINYDNQYIVEYLKQLNMLNIIDYIRNNDYNSIDCIIQSKEDL